MVLYFEFINCPEKINGQDNRQPKALNRVLFEVSKQVNSIRKTI